MRRSLSTKLVLAVLGAVTLPFLGLALFIGSEIDTRLKENVVQKSLHGLAVDLAGEIDVEVRQRNRELLLLAAELPGDWAIDEHVKPASSGAWGPEAMAEWIRDPEPVAPWPEESLWRRTQTAKFDRHVGIRGVYDLLLLVAADGRVVACSSHPPGGDPWSPETLESLLARDFSGEPWFGRAMGGRVARVDHHRTDLVPPPPGAAVEPSAGWHVAFAAPVQSSVAEEDVSGVLYALVNWRHFQEIVDTPEIKSTFSGLVRDKEPSPYAWIWGSDADTILAHEDRGLYRQRVSEPPIALPQMVEDARSEPSGLYREYEFRGNVKNAAFHHTAGPALGDLDGGFGWVVGVGIDNDDIYAMAGEVRGLLYRSTAVVLLLVMLWILVIARRTTRPILALQQHTRRVAEGDLDVEAIEVETGDELEALAEDFNDMVRELREKRAQLIRAEKDAAWREMARQIAHDIKNPLTPIKLSLDLLQRAREERSPDYERILERTLALFKNQVSNLPRIARDFYEFTGGRRAELQRVAPGRALAEVLDLHRAWADELGVRIEGEAELRADESVVLADPVKLQRVLGNLVTNAFHAMPRGGTLSVSVGGDAETAVLEIRDTGIGLSEEVREHLFEPYFTTKSEGTGLGLAIARRVVEEIGGDIALEPRADGRGTCARLRLPRAAAARGDAAADGAAKDGLGPGEMSA